MESAKDEAEIRELAKDLDGKINECIAELSAAFRQPNIRQAKVGKKKRKIKGQRQTKEEDDDDDDMMKKKKTNEMDMLEIISQNQRIVGSVFNLHLSFFLSLSIFLSFFLSFFLACLLSFFFLSVSLTLGNIDTDEILPFSATDGL